MSTYVHDGSIKGTTIHTSIEHNMHKNTSTTMCVCCWFYEC